MDERGFTIIEVLIASVVLLVALLTLGAMFPASYRQVADAGRMTLAVTGARQALEDVGALPFDSVANLNGFDTTNSATLPASGQELAIARRWRYMLAGEGSGFTFTTAELAQWGAATPFGGRGTIQVCDPGVVPPAPPAPCPAPVHGTQRQVRVSLAVPGLLPSVQLTTILVRLF